MAQVAKSLPLPLTREHAPLSIVALELPLALSRQLGELPTTEPTKPPSVSAIYPALYSASATTATCLNAKGSPSTQSVAVLGFDYGVALDVLACTAVKTTALPSLMTNGNINISPAESVKHCGQSSVSPMDRLKTCSDEAFAPAELLKSCSDETASPAKLLKACRNAGYEKAVRPACEWIDVPIVEPPKPQAPPSY